MKATELRIGNYVGRQSSKMIRNREEVYQIENVTRQTESKYEPIELTKEWLINFGFSEILKDAFRFETFDIELLHFHNERSCFFITSMCLWDVEIHVRYVHQLQNIFFSLTGKELKQITK